MQMQSVAMRLNVTGLRFCHVFCVIVPLQAMDIKVTLIKSVVLSGVYCPDACCRSLLSFQAVKHRRTLACHLLKKLFDSTDYFDSTDTHQCNL